MKPKNFPGRKAARIRAVEIRAEGLYGTCHTTCHDEAVLKSHRVKRARERRTKKYRGER